MSGCCPNSPDPSFLAPPPSSLGAGNTQTNVACFSALTLGADRRSKTSQPLGNGFRSCRVVMASRRC
ncbi:hypothetical protein GOODEAATRI_020768 [Goodea atripinnis]|uniref:Uncharacterized protein n=1 Tax=Goodea atripinnis TaxID=208336 RepID=A0ABV0NLZ3_9TELE